MAVPALRDGSETRMTESRDDQRIPIVKMTSFKN